LTDKINHLSLYTERRDGAVQKKKRDLPKIDIYRAWCKACGICAAFCPTGVLDRDEGGYPYVKEPQKCINCGWCEIRCPDFAITVEKKKEDAGQVRN